MPSRLEWTHQSHWMTVLTNTFSNFFKSEPLCAQLFFSEWCLKLLLCLLVENISLDTRIPYENLQRLFFWFSLISEILGAPSFRKLQCLEAVSSLSLMVITTKSDLFILWDVSIIGWCPIMPSVLAWVQFLRKKGQYHFCDYHVGCWALMVSGSAGTSHFPSLTATKHFWVEFSWVNDILETLCVSPFFSPIYFTGVYFSFFSWKKKKNPLSFSHCPCSWTSSVRLLSNIPQW